MSEASDFDLEEIGAADRFADWAFEQFRSAVSADVAEVGAGIGTFSSRLLDAGAKRLLLVEPDPRFMAVLQERWNGDARVTLACEQLPDSEALAARARSLGLVLCQNVLEHIDDDAAAVAAMAAALRPGGRLGLLVPAHPRLYGSLDRAYGHHRRYTPGALRQLVEGAGLQVLDLYSFNLLGVPGWWARSVTGSERLGARSMALFDRLVPLWRPLEQRLRPRWGLSLVVHARSPD